MIHTVLTDEQATLAALYVLGSLDPEAALAFERHLSDDACAVCRAEVEAMGGVVGYLGVAPTPAAPSPSVRSNLFTRVAETRDHSGRALAFAFGDEGEWIELKPGVFRKDLSSPTAGDPSRSYLIRMEPGTVLDRHGHDHFEHCYVVSGSTVVLGRRMGPGDYSYAPRGAVHEEIPSDEGALLFIVETP
jgi:quercetin dioxygenase-like cupin family protein